MSEQTIESNDTPKISLSDEEFDCHMAALRQQEKVARAQLKLAEEKGWNLEPFKHALGVAQDARLEADGQRHLRYPAAVVSPSLTESRNPLERGILSEELIQYLQTAELSPEERQICLDIINDGMEYKRPETGRVFSQVAFDAICDGGGTEEFLNYFLREHMGDPILMGRNKPKNPEVHDGLSEYKHDYSHTLVNGYVEGDDSDSTHEDRGHFIHIRETYEQGVDNKERYLVIMGNIATREVNSFSINEVNVDKENLTTKLWVTTNQFDLLGGALPPSSNTAESVHRRAEEARARRAAHDRQAFVQLSTHRILFKRFGGQVQEVSPISNVVYDRRWLTLLAVAAGMKNNAGEAIQLPDYLSERAA